MPLERAKIIAIPMIPIEPAKLVKKVRVFLVIRLRRDRERAVKKDMEAFFSFFFLSF